MTNDAIKKMARDWWVNFEGDPSVSAGVDEEFQAWERTHTKAFIAGASAHAKLLSEKGVEGAMKCEVYWLPGFYQEQFVARFDDKEPDHVSAIDFIQADVALHKIEQLERQDALLNNEKRILMKARDTNARELYSAHGKIKELELQTENLSAIIRRMARYATTREPKIACEKISELSGKCQHLLCETSPLKSELDGK